MKNSRFSIHPLSFLSLALVSLCFACSGTEEQEPTPEPPVPWNGKTYYLEVPRTHWAKPRGIGTDIADYVPGFLLRVEGEDPAAFQVMTGMADPYGAQNTCTQTGNLTGSKESSTHTISAEEFPIHIVHTNQPIAVDGIVYDLTMTDVLPNKGKTSEVGVLSATMDFRQIYELFTAIIDRTPELVCTTLEMTYSHPCQPCPSDNEPYCLTVEANDLGAVPFDGEIEPVDTLDASCTPPPEEL